MKTIFLLTSALLLTGLSSALHAQEKIRVYAASSMTNAIDALVEQFEATRNITVSKVYAGTSSLARQIEQGAPADVFISANLRWTDYLIENGIVSSDNVSNLARNQLVVVSNDQIDLNLTQAESWELALDGGRFAIGQTQSVPVGIYAKEALQSMGVWEQIQRYSAPTNNVRTALALAERGEVPLAVVYLTDAKLSDTLNIAAFIPSDTHSPITYPIAKLNDDVATVSFVDYLLSSEGQAVLKQFGFQ